MIERQIKARRLDCPYVFHQGGRKIGDFRKAWQTACTANGLHGRIVHDLRRSGVRHLIHAGIDPHTVMAFSGHRTDSMLKLYHIIALDDLRRAAQRGSTLHGQHVAGASRSARRGNAQRTRRVRPFRACVAELSER